MQNPAAHTSNSQLWTTRPERTQKTSPRPLLVRSTTSTRDQNSVRHVHTVNGGTHSTWDVLHGAATGERGNERERGTVSKSNKVLQGQPRCLFVRPLHCSQQPAIGDANRLANPPFIPRFHLLWPLWPGHPMTPFKVHQTGHLHCPLKSPLNSPIRRGNSHRSLLESNDQRGSQKG